MKKKPASFTDPDDLGEAGRAFWDVSHSDLSDSQLLLLFEVCRIKDQIARFDTRLATIGPIESADDDNRGTIEWALGRRSNLSALMAKHVAQLRLGRPATNGAGNPGGARGSYQNQPAARSAAEVRSQMRSVG